jgi:hypothetical protein
MTVEGGLPMRHLIAHTICSTWKIIPILALGMLAFSIALSPQEVPSVHHRDDQACAIGSLCTIDTAEFNYSKQYGKGFSPTLVAMRTPPEGVELSPEAAGFLDDHLADGKKCNFIFTYKAGPRGVDGKIDAYTVTAQPVMWRQGVKSFFTDQTWAIRWTDQNRPPKASDPILPSACQRGPK